MIFKVIAFKRDGSLIGKLISLVTGSDFTHAGILLGSKFYDASETRGSVGSDHKLEDYLGRDCCVWELDITNPYFSFWVSKELGRKYDYVGVLGWLFCWGSKSKVYCFEWVLEALAASKGVQPSYYTHSVGFKDIATKLNKEVVYLGEVSNYVE